MTAHNFTHWTPETKAAYAAGIIDGEGCISIGTRNNFSLQVQLGQSLKGKPMIDFFVGEFDAKTAKPIFHTNKPNRQAMIHCFWLDLKAAEFLKIISPYLIFKCHQAKLALYFYGIKSQRISHSRHGNAYLVWAKEQYLKMRFLNRKGHENNKELTFLIPNEKTLFD